MRVYETLDVFEKCFEMLSQLDCKNLDAFAYLLGSEIGGQACPRFVRIMSLSAIWKFFMTVSAVWKHRWTGLSADTSVRVHRSLIRMTKNTATRNYKPFILSSNPNLKLRKLKLSLCSMVGWLLNKSTFELVKLYFQIYTKNV